MDILLSMELCIPVNQIILLLMLSTLALLFGRKRLALLINYVFTMYWGYFLSIDQFTDSGVQGVSSYTMLYFGIGFLVVILAIVGFLRQE